MCSEIGCNLICGPAPLSLSKLKNLRDFELFTPAPSETLYIPRAFEARTFQRLFEWGPSAHLNNVHWKDDEAVEETLPLSIDILESVIAGSGPQGPDASAHEVFSPSISRWLGEKENEETKKS